MRILLVGSGSQLAHDLRASFAKDEVVEVSHPELDICDGSGVEGLVERVRPDCIVNTAAFNRVDDCEEQWEKAMAVNMRGVLNVARAAQRVGASIVHFSTNYVFDGEKKSPYLESDCARPLSIYGISKLAGEWMVLQHCERYFLVRTAGLYGIAGAKREVGNLPERMLRLARQGDPIRVVNDQVLTPTSARDMAQKLVSLIRTDRYGLYHMTNTGQCSWYEFACEVFRQAGLSPEILPIATAAFRAKARRPAYSVLDNAALRAAGFSDLRPWQEALAEYLRERGKQ